jgi:hypothetical protein
MMTWGVRALWGRVSADEREKSRGAVISIFTARRAKPAPVWGGTQWRSEGRAGKMVNPLRHTFLRSGALGARHWTPRSSVASPARKIKNRAESILVARKSAEHPV